MEDLKPHFHVIAICLRGYGYSSYKSKAKGFND